MWISNRISQFKLIFDVKKLALNISNLTGIVVDSLTVRVNLNDDVDVVGIVVFASNKGKNE